MRQFENRDACLQTMGSPRLLVLLLVGLMLAPVISATEGRAAPECAEFDLSDLVSSSSGIAVEPGACLIVDIGVRNHQTTLAIDYEILDDAMDVLMFDQNGIQTYENGQNYRSSFNPEASFESMIGSEWFDWAPPQSINAKNWYVVFDNSNHDGDEGQGDQGGMTSRFKIQLAPASVEQYPLIHDTFILQPGEVANLATFNVDSGTELSYWVHPISGTGDLYVQSDNQLGGNLIIADTDIEDFAGQDTTQLDWVVPSYLNLQNLNLMAEAGANPVHFSVKAWFDPVLAPSIVDYSNATTTIGQTVTLDASDSPNSLQQIKSLNWDFDSDMVFDATGELVEASWSTPGLKTINLTAESESGSTTIASHQIQVFDVEDPVAVIIGTGGVMVENGDRRLLRLSDMVLQASNSYDDHAIASASWSVDGELSSSASQFTVSWSQIGTYVVTLTVSDPSGNTGSTNITIIVYDSTEPILVTTDITDITEVEQGKEIEFKAKAADEWDSQDSLIFTWDLDLSKDTNGDGDTTNDPDFTGAVLTTSFDEIGENRFAVTVYDESGNSDFEVFEIQVVEPPSDEGLFAIIAVVFFVVVIVSGVVLFGYKGIQRRHAMEMLMEGGLSRAEAAARIESISRGTKLPMFAKAMDMAGISGGGEIKSSQQLQSEAKMQEFQSIYGNDPQSQTDPNAGFRPSNQVRQVDPALAEAALAAFADEPQTKPVASSTPVSGKVKSGGIALPPVSKPAIHTLRSECTSCGKAFSVNMPPNVNSAVVSCPSCGSDQLFER